MKVRKIVCEPKSNRNTNTDVTYMNKGPECLDPKIKGTSAVTKALEESSNGEGLSKCGFSFARYKRLLETDYTTE